MSKQPAERKRFWPGPKFLNASRLNPLRQISLVDLEQSFHALCLSLVRKPRIQQELVNFDLLALYRILVRFGGFDCHCP